GPQRHPYLTARVVLISLSRAAVACSGWLHAEGINELSGGETFEAFDGCRGEEHCAFKCEDKVPWVDCAFCIEACGGVGAAAGRRAELADRIIGKAFGGRVEKSVTEESRRVRRGF